MLLTVTTTGGRLDEGSVPATDLGYVVHKHPDNLRAVSTAAGEANVFWPEATSERATMALLVEVDPVGLVRRGGGPPLAAYVNDRPFVASSFLSVAIGRLFRTAMNGDCQSRPELVDHRWPVSVALPAIPVGGDPALVHGLFRPLGYETAVEVPPLDPEIPAWGPAPVGRLRLEGEVTMRDLLRHLYVLLPVLDRDKHYWIDEAEVAKLLRHGEGWLADHPEQELITRRYLREVGRLSRLALDQLGADATLPDDDESDAGEASIERPLSLNDQRLAAVVAAVRAAAPASVADLGCGEGRLLGELAADRSIDRLIGCDVSPRALQSAARRLRLDRRPERQRPSVELRQSSLTYRDRELADIDLACLVEVIEHLDPPRLDALEPIVFRHTRPRTVVITTPNREYNELFDLEPGALRHRDHRFEWTRAELAAWCDRVAEAYGYAYSLTPIGPVDEQRGAPTQMAVLTRDGGDG